MIRLIQLLRWPNLLMVAAVQGIVFFQLVRHEESVLSLTNLFLLVLVTILLAGGGYIINDYYDAGTDRINRPHRWIAGNELSMAVVLRMYMLVVLAGLLVSVVLALRMQLTAYLFLYILATVGLWLYSFKLKCTSIAGNLWVALFCAGVVLIVVVPDLVRQNPEVIQSELWIYMAFAFLATWYRELIKDLEDVDGDRQIHCETFVIRYGERKGKYLAWILGVMLLLALAVWLFMQGHWFIQCCIGILLVAVGVTLYIVERATSPAHFHHASQITKVIMLAGTLLLCIQ